MAWLLKNFWKTIESRKSPEQENKITPSILAPESLTVKVPGLTLQVRTYSYYKLNSALSNNIKASNKRNDKNLLETNVDIVAQKEEREILLRSKSDFEYNYLIAQKIASIHGITRKNELFYNFEDGEKLSDVNLEEKKNESDRSQMLKNDFSEAAELTGLISEDESEDLSSPRLKSSQDLHSPISHNNSSKEKKSCDLEDKLEEKASDESDDLPAAEVTLKRTLEAEVVEVSRKKRKTEIEAIVVLDVIDLTSSEDALHSIPVASKKVVVSTIDQETKKSDFENRRYRTDIFHIEEPTMHEYQTFRILKPIMVENFVDSPLKSEPELCRKIFREIHVEVLERHLHDEKKVKDFAYKALKSKKCLFI